MGRQSYIRTPLTSLIVILLTLFGAVSSARAEPIPTPGGADGTLPPAPGPEAQALARCPQAQALNGVAVCVDRGPGALYTEGDPITICVTVNIPQIAIFPPPSPPLIRVTNRVNNGPPVTLIETATASGQRCIQATIAAPFGSETIRAEAVGSPAISDSVSYQSVPRFAPSGTITVDRGEGGLYQPGDSITVCYTVPGPGPLTITDYLGDGTSHPFYSVYDDGRGDCVSGTVTPPLGTECFQLDFPEAVGAGAPRVCFRVDRVVRPPTPRMGTISTDRPSYRIGETARICYGVPAAGMITITVLLPGGASRPLLTVNDDGFGDCFSRPVAAPVGLHCLRLDYAGGSAQSCFQALG